MSKPGAIVGVEATKIEGVKNVLVYKFGLLPPNDNAELVYEQLQLAHKYRNQLVEIERERRASQRATLSSYDDIRELEVAARTLKNDLEEARLAVKARRALDRKKSENAAARELVKACRERLKRGRATLAERRRVLREDSEVQQKLEAINALAVDRHKSARAACGVYWGTYLLIEGAMDASRKMPLYDGEQPNDPRFVPWSRANERGSVGVQLQQGLAAPELFGDGTLVRVVEPDARAWWSDSRAERRRLARTTLTLRVGSTPTGKPIWASWPMVMHRPLPDGAIIKRVVVNKTRCASRDAWTVNFTISLPSGASPRNKLGTGKVGIDIGWRLIDGGLRVAVGVDDQGEVIELRLTAHELNGLRVADSLRSTRDSNLNEMKAKLKAWSTTGQAPEWFRTTTKTLTLWRSPGRFSALARRWRSERFDGDEEGYTILESWRYHDDHLWRWECFQRRKSLRRRREIYRVFAARLAERYDTVLMEAFDLRRMARKLELGDGREDENENKTARWQRYVAGLSELRNSVLHAFSRRGGKVVTTPSQCTTTICHECQHDEPFDAAVELVRECPGCGATWDQDINAADNILNGRYCERPGGSENGSSARVPPSSEDRLKPEGKWERVARLRQRKKVCTG